MDRWLILVGLALTILGAAIAAWNVMINDATAEKLSATMWNGNKALKRALLAQSRGAALGLALVALGTALQIVGALAADV